MLLTTVLLWALNLSVTKVILDEGLAPLSYATVRYGLAAAIFVGLALAVEGTLRIARGHLRFVALAAVTLWVNQVCFVFALDLTAASTVGILLGAIPSSRGCSGSRWAPSVLSGGSGSLPRSRSPAWRSSRSGAAGEVSGGSGRHPSRCRDGCDVGRLLGRLTPLMKTYSLTRVSAVVFPHVGADHARGLPETTDQDWSLGWEIWLLLVFATVGPLVVTNVLWFRSIRRVGASPRDPRREPAAVRRGGARGDPALRAARRAAGARRGR